MICMLLLGLRGLQNVVFEFFFVGLMVQFVGMLRGFVVIVVFCVVVGVCVEGCGVMMGVIFLYVQIFIGVVYLCMFEGIVFEVVQVLFWELLVQGFYYFFLLRLCLLMGLLGQEQLFVLLFLMGLICRNCLRVGIYNCVFILIINVDFVDFVGFNVFWCYSVFFVI